MAAYITDETQYHHCDSLGNIHNITEKAEITLVKAKEYFLQNGLMINLSKAQCIFIGSRQLIAQIPDNITIDFHGTIVFPSTHVKT